MMRCGSPDNPQIIALAREVPFGIPEAIGVIELLGVFVQDYCPRGAVGKWGNDGIAEALGYPDSKIDGLVVALVKTGWVKRSDDLPGGLFFRDHNGKLGGKYRRQMNERAAGGQITAKLRKLVLDRDGAFCRYCAATEDLTIDHKTPISLGGTNDPINLQALCRPCNSRKRDTPEDLDA